MTNAPTTRQTWAAVKPRSLSLVLERSPIAVMDAEIALLAPVAQEQEVVAGAAIDAAAGPVMGVNRVVALAAIDVVVSMARIDEVVAGAAIEAIALAGRLAAGFEVAPDDISGTATVNQVVAMSAQKLVALARTTDNAILVVRVTLVIDRLGPPVVASVTVHRPTQRNNEERQRCDGRSDYDSASGSIRYLLPRGGIVTMNCDGPILLRSQEPAQWTDRPIVSDKKA